MYYPNYDPYAAGFGPYAQHYNVPSRFRYLWNPPLSRKGRNKKAGPCFRCKREVGVQKGLLVLDEGASDWRDKWRVYHYDCAPSEIKEEVAVSQVKQEPVIPFEVEGDRLVIHPPTAYMGDKFWEMVQLQRECCQTEQREGKYYATAPLDRTHEVAATFEQAGFKIAVSAELAKALESRVVELDEITSKAMARMEIVDQILHEIGMARIGKPFHLYDFQRIGATYLASRRKALLADDMGLGKTLMSCIGIPEFAPAVMVVPASVTYNWAEELAQWRPDRSPAEILEGTDSFKRWPQPGETFVTSYARLPKKLPGKAVPGTVLICDEAHNLKTLQRDWRTGLPIEDPSKSSQRAVRFWYMGDSVLKAGGAVWLLTGTPLMNRPQELWAVLDQADLAGDAFGSWPGFIRAFNVHKVRVSSYREAYDWKNAWPSEDVPGRLQRVMLRREKIDALPELPPKTRQDLVVEIDPQSRAELDELADETLRKLVSEQAKLRGGASAEDIKAFHVFREAERVGVGEREAKLTDEEKEMLQETRKATPGFETISKARMILAKAKIPALLQIVDQYEAMGEPIVVFSAHRAPLEALVQRPGWEFVATVKKGKRKPRTKTLQAKIDGGVPVENRHALIKAFQAGQLPGAALSIRAAGVGITLTRANVAVFLDRDWTPAANMQAEDRIWRIGQYRPVTILNLIADHEVDQSLSATLDRKEELVRASVDAAKRMPNEEFAEPTRLIPAYVPPPISGAPFDPETAGFEAGPIDPEATRARIEQHERAMREQERILREAEEREYARQHAEQMVGAPGRRGPLTFDEEWAAGALSDLAAMDPDFAREKNEIGFAAPDTRTGHQLAAYLAAGAGLTDEEWSGLLGPRGFLRYYKGQIGLPPSATEGEQEEAEKAEKQHKARVQRAKRAPKLKSGDWVTSPEGEGVVVGKEGKGPGLRWQVQLQGTGEVVGFKRKELEVGAPLAEPEAIEPVPPVEPGQQSLFASNLPPWYWRPRRPAARNPWPRRFTRRGSRFW